MIAITSKWRAAVLIAAVGASLSGCATGRCGWRDGGPGGDHHRGDQYCRGDRHGDYRRY